MQGATPMKQVFVVTMIFAALTLNAQQPPLDSALLDHLAGKWLMQGSVGKQPVTHEFEAEWVLQHHYLRFHEVSRVKNDLVVLHQINVVGLQSLQ